MDGNVVGHLPPGGQMEAHADWHPAADRKHTVDDLLHRHMETLGVNMENNVILVAKNRMGTVDEKSQSPL
jgi:hypothetical protein